MCVLQTLVTEACPPDTRHAHATRDAVPDEGSVNSGFRTGGLSNAMGPREIPTRWHVKLCLRVACAVSYRAARSLPSPPEHRGVAARRDSHLTALPRPDERPGQGRSSSRMFDTEQRHKYYVYSYI